VKYARDFVIVAQEETVLQGMNDGLIETARCYRMEIGVGKTEVMRI
jgi:hypothetical protein